MIAAPWRRMARRRAPNLRFGGLLPSRGARCARLSPCRRPRTAAATARPFNEHRTMSIETWTAERIEQLRHCVVYRPDLQSDRRRDRRHPQRRHRQNPPPRPVAGAARGCPGAFLPSTRPAPADLAAKPAVSLDRRAGARRRRRRSRRRCRSTARSAARCSRSRKTSATGRSAIRTPRILRFAATRRSPASHTAPVTPAWPIACRRGGVPRP